MMLAVGLAIAMKPTTRMAEQKPPVNLELMIPRVFADWKLDPSLAPIILSPDVQAKLDNIYNQTLSRAYVNGIGSRVMLSIAYGADQLGESMQVHRPEFCYTSQGFEITKNAVSSLSTSEGVVPVRRLIAQAGSRTEPITYWITVGEQAALPGVSRKVAQLRYGLTGTVPDGMLIRVSSIGIDEENQYALQDRFLRDLLGALSPDKRITLLGGIRASSER